MVIRTLTEREVLVMRTLWENGDALTVSDIAAKINLSLITVSSILNRLCQEDPPLVTVGQIVRRGKNKVFARSYVPTITKDEYIEKVFFGENK